jgi:uncharacterized membrane protein
LRESRWIAFVGVGLYLVMILATYSKGDPGWSHEATGATVGNAGALTFTLPALLAGVEALVISHTARFPLFHLPWRQIRVASFPNQDQLVGLLP